jgi:sialic acid synthase SpsE
MSEIRIADDLIGNGHPCYTIAEIGINHNGEVELAKKLIDVAVSS